MDAIEAIRGRRSVRAFLPHAVEQPVIAAIIADAAHAPWTPISAPEPWVFNVIEGRDRIADCGVRALAYAREHRPQVAGYGWADDPAFSVFHGAPAVVIISGKTTNPLALEECTRAGQLLAISAHARGVGACWVGSPNLWLRDINVRAELLVPEGFTPHAAFALGYAASIPDRPAALSPPRTTWLGDDIKG